MKRDPKLVQSFAPFLLFLHFAPVSVSLFSFPRATDFSLLLSSNFDDRAKVGLKNGGKVKNSAAKLD